MARCSANLEVWRIYLPAWRRRATKTEARRLCCVLHSGHSEFAIQVAGIALEESGAKPLLW